MKPAKEWCDEHRSGARVPLKSPNCTCELVEAVRRDAIESFAREVVAKLSDGSKRTHLAHAHFCDAAQEVEALARVPCRHEWGTGSETCPKCGFALFEPPEQLASAQVSPELTRPANVVEKGENSNTCARCGSTHLPSVYCPIGCEPLSATATSTAPGAETLQQVPVTACKHEHFTHVYFGEDVCDDCGKSVDNARCIVCHQRPAACKHEAMRVLYTSPVQHLCYDCGARL